MWPYLLVCEIRRKLNTNMAGTLKRLARGEWLAIETIKDISNDIKFQVQ